jgi:hypothetical protein
MIFYLHVTIERDALHVWINRRGFHLFWPDFRKSHLDRLP